MEDAHLKATVSTENSRTKQLAKRKLALRGVIRGSTLPWLEIPVQDHPRPPNPYDPYSKRQWEAAMQAYRHEIRETEKKAKEYLEKNMDLQHQAKDLKSITGA